MAPRYRAPLPADAGGPFVNGAEKANGRPTLGRPSLVLHSWPRAGALHCLLAQAGHSLMAQKKQMAVPLWDDRLFFLCAHYIKDKYKFLMSSKVGSFGLPGRRPA